MLGMTGRPRFTSPWHALGAAWLAWAGSASAAPAAQLQCQVTYAGTTHTVLADPVQDPYPVPSVDIGGRFRFKPIVVGTAQRVDRVLIYAYLVDGSQALLIHQAKYLSPFPSSGSPRPLTGQQYLYAGPLERELIYSCTLLGGTP
jgi:hypothetical protein